MRWRLTEPQKALLKLLPKTFMLRVDYRKGNCPPTVVTDLSGRELFRFGRGHLRAFDSLWHLGAVHKAAGHNHGDLYISEFQRRA